MADTQPLAPTDAEIDALDDQFRWDTTEGRRAFASAVLAKWGAQPVPAGYALVPAEPTDAMVQAAHHLDLSYMPGHEGADRAAIYRAMLAAAPQPVVREPLTDEQIFDCVNVALPGKGHRVISETDPEYAKDVGIEPGARRIVSEVHPEHSIAFARAIERAHGITTNGRKDAP